MSEEYVSTIVYEGDVPVPSLDMNQPIIRCKDCKWRRESYWHDGERKHRDGSYCCGYWGGSYTAPNDFCSHGEEVEP